MVLSMGEIKPKPLHFKMFGRYDVLEISRFSDLNEAIRGNSDGRILSINTFPCFSWDEQQAELWNKLNTASSPVVSLLKLQDKVFKEQGIDGLKQVADYLSTFGPSKGYALIGMGYYEILLWLPGIKFDGIFEYTNKLRKLKIIDVLPSFDAKYGAKGLFADTTTIPLISYKNIIQKKAWTKLSGKVTPIVKIKTAPGQEDSILTQWPVEWRQLLGAEDLVFAWDKPVPLSEFVPDLINFRRKWLANHAVIDTSTRLVSNEPYKVDGTSSSILPAVTGPLPPLFEKLRDLGKTPNVNPFVISEIINIISLINTNIGNMSLLSSDSYIIYSINYLNSLLVEYQAVAAGHALPMAARLEDYLLDYANCVYAAILQHFPSKDFSEFSSNTLPYAGSLSRIITAISVLPEHLFTVVCKSDPPERLVYAGGQPDADPDLVFSLDEFKNQWQGFLFLNLSEGYKVVDQSEIIYTPYKDIFQVLNWITLSHEISHAYYCRLNFELLEREWLQDITDSIDVQEAHREYTYSVNELCSELFAHWFDFTHFFDRDVDFYLWSIWRTWVKLPRTHQYKKYYWIRSIFICLCSKWETIEVEIQKVFIELNREAGLDALVQIMMRELEAFACYVKSKFPIEYPTIEPTQDEKLEIVSVLINYPDFIVKFEENYINRKIIRNINRSYKDIKDDIASVNAGVPISQPIPNPFLFLREILRSRFESNDKSVLPDNTTVAIIYSLWETSRKFKRVIPDIK